jgi:hypothetical protein
MSLNHLSSIGIVDVLIIFLAVYRLSVMLHHDDELGPWQLIYRMKIRLGVEESDYGNLFGRPGTFQEALLCYFCNSPWIGMIIVLLYAILVVAGAHWLARLLFIPFAASGFTVLLAKYTD